ncbi:LysR family transcriptional regulator [Mycolicibacterium parafortuitum]|uniref:Probable hydrogen peroxide-inducible genes activator n=1 Tax=Mycolicibacterium parafortuitum TaxID=39692 RepID=A0A375YFI5_MYCPF|nr:LysR family transcriptional regulator [Mycolicibacterium parafortuitum]ORB31380.1 LysR family transcriptional regulator [Mycolicibacterium parafortuitum]SRX79873.1 LysR family transcriptional regulator [Pseudonocardia dioxanivorans] [Mycolicibacterium parafortuitum]
MPTLLQLRALVAVADEHGFTSAGYQLGMPQPSVSRAVAALETELGARLVRRGRDDASLTEAGEAAVSHAREALRHIAAMRTDVDRAAGGLTGTLWVASLPSVTASLVTPQLEVFAQHHPAVAIRLLEGSEEEVLNWLDGGAAEAGVVSLPVSGMESAVLGTQDMVAVVPADHRLAGFGVVEYTDLAKEPFVRSTGGCATVFTPVAQSVGVEFDVAFEARSVSAVLEIVRSGLGVSIMPSAGLPDLPDGVVTRPLLPRTVRALGLAVSASASEPARALLRQLGESR